MKTCSGCGATTALSNFPAKGRMCKGCVSARNRLWRQENKIAVTEREQQYRQANAAARAEANLRYREKNAAAIAERTRLYRLANPEAAAEAVRRWRRANPLAAAEGKRRWAQENAVGLAEAKRRYRKENAASIAEYHRRYQQENPEKSAAKKARRKAKILDATPSWADSTAILAVYAQADALKRLVGDVHVDHIVPLQSPYVCGLHVQQNLEVIDDKENMRKSNTRWPDMWPITGELRRVVNPHSKGSARCPLPTDSKKNIPTEPAGQ